ncbi:MAG: 50S ribosomal protein L17 [Patescibacteria group bacterium]|nr:50S ribosomal protein L17 [Patescibacteria group bacterium]
MLFKKLAFNFLTKGKLTTTLAKAKVLKSYLEKLLEKTKELTGANKNFLLKKIIPKKRLINALFTQVGPAIKEKKGGYLRLIKLGRRMGDGAEMARIEWTVPIVVDLEKKKEEKKEKNETKKEKKEITVKKVKKTIKK